VLEKKQTKKTSKGEVVGEEEEGIFDAFWGESSSGKGSSLCMHRSMFKECQGGQWALTPR
jgi:hypothetical protein